MFAKSYSVQLFEELTETSLKLKLYICDVYNFLDNDSEEGGI